MKTKQTAVSYLEEVIKDYAFGDSPRLKKAIEQAKAMEKEQISNGYYQGLIDGMNNSPKEYYNKTYGK